MNLLAEVLSSVEEVELDTLNKKVPELNIKIENVKSNVIQYIEKVYVKYRERPKKNKELFDKAAAIEEEIRSLKKIAEHTTKKELVKTTKTLVAQHLSTLETIDVSLQIVLPFCHINEILEDYNGTLSSKEYVKCVKLIRKLNELVMQLPEIENSEIVSEIQTIINTKKISLVRILTENFSNNIYIVNESNNVTAINVKTDLKENGIEQVLKALYEESNVVYPLNNLAKCLWNHVFVPIVDYKTQVIVNKDDEFHVLKITTKDTSRKSSYQDVFANLKIVLQFLNEHCNILLNDNLSSLEYIGIDIRDNLSELLIKHCLQDTIPSNAVELQQYNVVIKATEDLEKTLQQTKIFDNSSFLSEYTKGIDVLFIEKKCNEYLLTSEAIMKKDLHEMMQLGDILEGETLTFGLDNQCFVSKCVIELMEYTEKIIQSAISSNDACASRQLDTVQNIFRNYCYFVPKYHKKLLETIPQQVALFHNNCFYIAYIFSKWNQIYLAKLKDDTFNDKITKNQIQTIGAKTFSSYVTEQIKQIEEIMKESKLDGPTLEKLDAKTEKCIRQCLRQQELLKTVWQKVLSHQIYNKTMGTILNSLCENLNNAIVHFEDISSVAAQSLMDVLKLVLTRGSKLFTDAKEVSLYVSSWLKLTEVNFVLGASLLDINDRWADSKGPLAYHLKPNDIKQLIRALFQNTDRRAAVLAKIN